MIGYTLEWTKPKKLNKIFYVRSHKYNIMAGSFKLLISYNQPYESFLSSLLDITIIKPLIEAYTGYDMINEFLASDEVLAPTEDFMLVFLASLMI